LGTSIKNIGGGFGKSSSFWPAHAQTGSAAKGLSRVLGRGVSPDPPSHWADSRSTTPSPRDRQHLWRPPMGAREGRPTGQKPCRQPRGPRRAARARRGIFDLRAIEDGLARAFPLHRPWGRVRTIEVASHGGTALGMGRDRRADVAARRHQPLRGRSISSVPGLARGLASPSHQETRAPAVINGNSPAHPRERPARRHSETGRRPP
jgi:hypothetical protein